jgi:hypothetical protein
MTERTQQQGRGREHGREPVPLVETRDFECRWIEGAGGAQARRRAAAERVPTAAAGVRSTARSFSNAGSAEPFKSIGMDGKSRRVP